MSVRVLLLALIVGVLGCFQYSPHELPSRESERDQHRKSLQRLQARPPSEPLRFAVVGDTQFFFDAADDVVESLNRREDLAFVIQMGDFSHLGLLPEFRSMKRIFDGLEVPYFVLFGIHDYLGNGEEIYERMFGPLNFAFTYARVRFVLLDDNAVEHGFDGSLPDLDWLAGELGPSPEFDRAIVFTHIPPTMEDFDPAVREPYESLLSARGVPLALYGHAHHEGDEVRGGVRHVIADAANHRTYLLVTVRPDGIDVETVGF